MPIWNENPPRPRRSRRVRNDLDRDNRANTVQTFDQRSIQMEGFGSGRPDWEVREDDAEYHNRQAHAAPRGRYARPTEDDHITRDIYELLANNRFIESQFIRVRVRHGFVRLNGMVTRPREHYLAEMLAYSVAGVREVDNRLEVDFGKRRPR